MIYEDQIIFLEFVRNQITNYPQKTKESLLAFNLH